MKNASFSKGEQTTLTIWNVTKIIIEEIQTKFEVCRPCVLTVCHFCLVLSLFAVMETPANVFFLWNDG